jgi:formamidopyrimidine-DNA glycosylase
MPELPEVEFARSCLERWLAGRRLVEVAGEKTRLLRGSSVDALEALSGHVVERITRRGKWFVLELDRGAGLVGHLGMTGKMVHAKRDEEVRWSRARFVTRDAVVHFQDSRMFGRLLPGKLAEITQEEGYRTLGPDAWDEPPTATGLAQRLRGRSRAIKDVLMDQTILAGLGNIQVTEALFRARLHPSRPAGELDRRELAALVRAIHWSLARTLAMNSGDKIVYVEEDRLHNPFLVYGRAGEPCPRCGTTLGKLDIGGRTSAFCPGCQAR